MVNALTKTQHKNAICNYWPQLQILGWGVVTGSRKCSCIYKCSWPPGLAFPSRTYPFLPYPLLLSLFLQFLRQWHGAREQCKLTLTQLVLGDVRLSRNWIWCTWNVMQMYRLFFLWFSDASSAQDIYVLPFNAKNQLRIAAFKIPSLTS